MRDTPFFFLICMKVCGMFLSLLKDIPNSLWDAITPSPPPFFIYISSFGMLYTPLQNRGGGSAYTGGYFILTTICLPFLLAD